MGEYIAVLLPSIGVGLIFWFVMRALFRADRGERRAQEAVQRDQADAERWYQELKEREGASGESSEERPRRIPDPPQK
ncbi:hypothetical protein [Kocuria palustris]|uniref:hypothetical protein n=1 Tax=Kocuria palustris TaxID=71999 RepID=UPI0011AA79A3|nr:hypothetical protein [Kocuria palustris]